MFLPTLILRHRKENKKKCSLRGLEKRSDMIFLEYPKDPLIDLSNYVLLELGAKELTEEDSAKGLFLIDATWNYTKTIRSKIPYVETRSLPSHYVTAYPRKQTGCDDPIRGLASIEALYLSYLILKRPAIELLTNYHWKKTFLSVNKLLD